MLVLYLLLQVAFCSENFYRAVTPDLSPSAVCLDGSAPLYYAHAPSDGDPTKILIYLMGGGSCGGVSLSETFENCYKASFTLAGSSLGWPSELRPQGLMSVKDDEDVFAGWTKIIIVYCDASFYQGSALSPIEYKGRRLYFRGGQITGEMFFYFLKKFNLDAASDVVLAGVSAGAVAVTLWANMFKNRIASNVKVIIDSGIFLDFPSIPDFPSRLMVQNILKLTASSTPFQECEHHYSGEIWKCIFYQYSHSFLQVPHLIINSQYDTYDLQLFSVDCLRNRATGGQTLSNCNQEQMARIDWHRQKLMQVLFVGEQSKQVWSISCANHVYTSSSQIYDYYEQRACHTMTAKDAIDRLIRGGNVHCVDDQPWPGNFDCAY